MSRCFLSGFIPCEVVYARGEIDVVFVEDGRPLKGRPCIPKTYQPQSSPELMPLPQPLRHHLHQAATKDMGIGAYRVAPDKYYNDKTSHQAVSPYSTDIAPVHNDNSPHAQP